MYSQLLTVHSYLRWIVLLTAVIAVVVSFAGMLGRRPFKPAGRKAGLIYTLLFDLQVLVGLVLYSISPIVHTAWANMSAAMKDPELRRFAVEHLTSMLIAVILVHIGSVRAKRAPTDQAAWSRALLWYSASLIIILIGIPWGRPLFRS